MTFPSRPLEARPRNWKSADARRSGAKGRGRKPVPDYEKPLVKTGEALTGGS